MSAGFSLPLGFRIGGYPAAPARAGLFPPFSFYFGGPGGAVVVPPDEEEPGAWSDYKQKLRLRLQLHYEYEPDGGLVFSGAAVCQQGRVFRRRDYVPQIGRTGDFGGRALVEHIQQFSVAYSGSGGLFWGGEAGVSSTQQVQDAVGSGGFGLGGEAITKGQR